MGTTTWLTRRRKSLKQFKKLRLLSLLTACSLLSATASRTVAQSLVTSIPAIASPATSDAKIQKTNTPLATGIGTTVSREAQLEARIRELEKAASERSAREIQLEQLLKSLEGLLSPPSAVASARGAQVPGAPRIDTPPGEEALVLPGINTGGIPNPNPLQMPADLNAGGDAPPGFDVVEEPQGQPTAASAATAAGDKPQMPFVPKINKGYAGVGPGFVISSDDDEYQIQFHNLTQLDLRQYNFQTMNPTRSTFGFPRQWTIVNGRLTKPIEYFVALNWGFTQMNLLDAFINIHYDDRLQVKLGRFKTPWSYEFYALPINGLISPERSVFFNNYGPNRDTGAMVWGQIFDKTTDYAVGGFNGIRNAFVDNNNAKEVIAYLNSRPLEKSGLDAFKYWNVGGSVSYNVYNGNARPEVFRTNVPYPGDPNVSPQWLVLNSGTQEFGSQKLWSLHSAWYYEHLSLIAEWYSGYETYAKQQTPLKGDQVATSGWYVQSGYFLTGEKVTGRG
ncbi:MAG: porin, partial [bacterium]